MSLTQWQREGRLQSHKTSRSEVRDLLAVAQRGLKDARVESISTDWRFAAAYEAALTLATIPLECAGYRTRGVGHHATTFEALPLVMGATFCDLADYFERCRMKRNEIAYRRAGVISRSEAEELIRSVAAFRQQVEQWLRKHHSDLAPG
ncbi:MAG: hypothetical protein FJX75_03685 [Armatimonadetes bacterium]|nr:hypothetical protein [Armatimonadota bacterium]